MRLRDFGALLLLGALWGATFLFLRIAIPSTGPYVAVAFRFLLAGGVTWLGAIVAGRRPSFQGRRREYVLLGVVNAALPATLLAVTTKLLNASLAAILNATNPIFVAVVAAIVLRDRLTTRKVAGIALGVAGVFTIAGWSPIPVDLGFVVGVITATFAMFCYAAGTIYATARFKGEPTLTLAIGQQVAAGIALIPIALATLPDEVPPLKAWLALLGLAFLPSVVGYLLFFWLLRQIGPTRNSMVTYLIPLFGVFFGALFLDEPLGWGTFAGLAIILTSVVLVTEVRLRPAAPTPVDNEEEAGTLPASAQDASTVSTSG